MKCSMEFSLAVWGWEAAENRIPSPARVSWVVVHEDEFMLLGYKEHSREMTLAHLYLWWLEQHCPILPTPSHPVECLYCGGNTDLTQVEDYYIFFILLFQKET